MNGKNISAAKKNFLILSLFFLLLPCKGFSQEAVQFVIPKRLCVGDTAEIRYNFHSSFELFEEADGEDEKEILLESLPFDTDNSDFTISRVLLQQNGDAYSLLFKFVPWKSGKIDFPKFDLLSVMKKQSSVPLEIALESITVQTLILDGETSLRPMKGPLLIPGTIYFVWLVIILVVAFLIALITMLVRRKAISSWIKNIILLSGYARNARRALRELKRLETKSEKFSDVDFAELIQKILRKYLSKRLGTSFDSVTSNKIFTVCQDSFGGFLEGERLSSTEKIAALFSRADYIRFARSSFESQKLPKERYSCDFLEGERENFIKEARCLIKSYEKNADVKEEENA